ncbi:MAG: hypothetical protein J2P34_09055, partial [Actinobacteria bacterium]|nr:hypothetical protein [Actinomycetota bacterium]
PRQLLGGAMEVDGLLNLDEFAEQTGLRLPEGPYETVAGYVLAVLGRLPTAGDAVEAGDRRLTVTELDGRRVARIRVSPAPPAPGNTAGAVPPAARAGDGSPDRAGRPGDTP